MLKFYIAAVLFVGVLGLGTAGFSYVKSLNAEIANLTSQNTELVNVAKTNQETIGRITQEKELLVENISALSAELSEAKKGKEELMAKLVKHDLEALSARKPGLIEKRINDATKKAFSDLEQLTSN